MVLCSKCPILFPCGDQRVDSFATALVFRGFHACTPGAGHCRYKGVQNLSTARCKAFSVSLGLRPLIGKSSDSAISPALADKIFFGATSSVARSRVHDCCSMVSGASRSIGKSGRRRMSCAIQNRRDWTVCGFSLRFAFVR
jgi:hypothetical protein